MVFYVMTSDGSYNWIQAPTQQQARDYAREHYRLSVPWDPVFAPLEQVIQDLSMKGWIVAYRDGMVITFKKMESQFEAGTCLLLLLFFVVPAIIYAIATASPRERVLSLKIATESEVRKAEESSQGSSLYEPPLAFHASESAQQVSEAVPKIFHDAPEDKQIPRINTLNPVDLRAKREPVNKISLVLNFLLSALLVFYLVYPSWVLKHRYQVVTFFQSVLHQK